VASAPGNQQRIDDGEAVADRPRLTARTPANLQRIADGEAVARIPHLVARTATQQRIDDGEAIATLPRLRASVPGNQQRIDDGEAVAKHSYVDRQREGAKAARVPPVPDNRSHNEQKAAGAAMVDSLVQQMVTEISPGDLFYAGAGNEDRCFDADGQPLPMSHAEHWKWFYRESSSVRSMATGMPLNTPELRSIADCITIFFPRDASGDVLFDTNHNVVDEVERLAQVALIDAAPPGTSVIKMVAAGTCANVKGGRVCKKGATVFGWVMKVRNLTTQQLATLRFLRVTPGTIVLDPTWRAPFASLHGPLPPVAHRSNVLARLAAADIPSSVTLVREKSVRGSYWSSETDGTRHWRKWGLLSEQEGFCTTYDYGVGGEICAELAHVRAVLAKLKAKRLLRKPYRMLEGGEAMPTCIASVGTAAVSIDSQPDSTSATDSEGETETDSEDDACERYA
jgi:hypothetical protein